MTEQRFQISNVWMQLRTKDMNFVIDTIKAACNDKSLAADTWVLQNEDGMSEILSHIDCSKIGLMGHSMGGATAVTVGRQRDGGNPNSSHLPSRTAFIIHLHAFQITSP